MEDLARKRCVPCEQGGEPMPAHLARLLLGRLTGWSLVDDKLIRRELVMKDFAAAVALVDAVARVAEAEGHHPDLHLTSYRRLSIELTTHAVGGLTENDFILAAKIDELPKALR